MGKDIQISLLGFVGFLVGFFCSNSVLILSDLCSSLTAGIIWKATAASVKDVKCLERLCTFV